MEHLSLEGPHWTFVTRFYAQPGVSSACLDLQDIAGVDVIVLLFMLYSERTGQGASDPGRIAAADALVASWRAKAILPLRAIRQALKGADAATPVAEAAELRKAVQAAEIRAEQISLAMLARSFAPPGISAAPTVGQRRPMREVVEDVARFYAKPAALQQRGVQAAVDFLGQAAETGAASGP